MGDTVMSSTQGHEVGEAVPPVSRAQDCMQSSSIFCMQSTSVRVDVATHEEIKRLARELGATVGETVALAVRRLRQERMGLELVASLRDDESAWLDAELG